MINSEGIEEVIHLRNRQKVIELNLLWKSQAKCVRIAFQFHLKRLKLLVRRKIFQAQRTTWKGTFNDELIQMYSFVNIGPFWKTHWNDTHLFLIQLLINESCVAMFFLCLRSELSTMRRWSKFRVKVLWYHRLKIIFSKIASYDAWKDEKVLICDKIRYYGIYKCA